ncbi:hypothetical protein [Alicyclobacillus pomorum]|uniref:hypothetical protein n=1 Tax=Alicyclobacillus pomorum TaxID=204470 RepID=UPI000408001E|nr:hypothetical protein [Alicyclobacillus pomorum]
MANIRIGQSLRVRLSEAAKEYYHSRLVEHNAKEYFDVPLHHQDHRILEVAPKSKVWVEFQGFDGAWCKYAATFLERFEFLTWFGRSLDRKLGKSLGNSVGNSSVWLQTCRFNWTTPAKVLQNTRKYIAVT